MDAKDAKDARALVLKVLLDKNFDYSSCFSSEIVLRMFLTSSRLFKKTLRKRWTSPDLTNILLIQQMLKFIWVAELSSKEFYIQKKQAG